MFVLRNSQAAFDLMTPKKIRNPLSGLIAHEVLAVDNFFTGSKSNISHRLDDKNFELLRQDIAPRSQSCSIFNLASPATPGHYQRDPVHTIKTYVLGAVNILGMAKRLRVLIFQASTTEVYGEPQMHPQT